MNLKKSIMALAASSVFVTGCSPLSVMKHKDEMPSTAAKAQKQVADQSMWDELPVMTEGSSAIVLITPESIPQKIQERSIALEWDTSVTVKDLVATLGNMGISVMISEKEIEDKAIYLPRFNGTIGQLLQVVSRATNVWFTWQDGVLVASTTVRIGLSVPQEAAFAEILKKGLTDLGISESPVAWEAGLIFSEVTPAQFQRYTYYIERMTANAAVVNLQVSIVNVTLNQNAKQGIDWNGMTIAATSGGTRAQLQALRTGSGLTGVGATTGSNTGVPGTGNSGTNNTNAGNTGNTGNTGNSGNTGGTGSTGNTGNTGNNGGTTTPTPTPTLDGSAGIVEMAGQALSGAIFTKRFSLGAMFSFLETYGDAKSDQSVMLRTVSGKKISFNSLIQVPFVAEISNANGNSSNITSSSTKTEKADDGIEVELTPSFDASANTVTIDLKLELKAVLGFNELSAGKNLGNLTQPTTANRKLEGTVQLRPGETAVVGGLTFDSVSDNRAGPVFLQRGSKLESQSIVVSRQTMFVVLRPTIVKLGNLELNNGGYNDNSLKFLTPAKK